MPAFDALLASSPAPDWLSVLGCLADVDHGWGQPPPVVPAWMLEQDTGRPDGPALDGPTGCACCLEDPEDLAARAVELEVRPEPEVPWAVPGVTGLGPVGAGPLPPPSPSVAALLRAMEVVASVRPAQVEGAQALSDAQALLQVEQQLRVHGLARIADVAARGLTELVGARSVKSWVREHRPDGDPGDDLLASRLKAFPVLQAAVQDGTVTLAAARQATKALRTCAPHLDRPDGLIDGLPGDLVLNAVVGNTAAIVCRELLGLARRRPAAAAHHRASPAPARSRGHAARAAGARDGVARRSHRPTCARGGALDEIVVAVLPSQLEERDRKGQERRGLSITELPDGQGWHLCGDLTLECGERFWTVLRAAVAHDSKNPDDTQAWADARAAGASDADDLWGPLGEKLDADGVLPKGLPRGRRKRLHDAFNNVLERYLAAGQAGLVSKNPVQINVTISEQTITPAEPSGTSSGTRGERDERRPGAPPPRAGSGRLIPRSLVRRWWCDSTVTATVLSLGGKALRTIHGQRTLSADERRALDLEGGARCAGDGCCPGLPDPLIVLRPHHVHGYAEDQVTSLDETLNVCDTLHHDLHTGKRTLRLRDGRWLNEHGFTAPTWDDENPPF